MSGRRDYYEVLEISREATPNEVKRAYRKVAVACHPDRNPDVPDAAEKFREATEAYEILKDPQKRAQYDRFGHAGLEGAFGGGAGGFGAGGMGIDLNDALESFLRNFGGGFGDIFGGGEMSARERGRGRNLQLTVQLSLVEAAHGATKKLRVKKQVACADCDGSGAAADSRAATCDQCRGMGRVRQVRRSLLGQMVTETACPRCGGRGQVIEDPCPSCSGTGTVRGQETVEVKIPAGVTTGNYMELEEQGDTGNQGGPAGDLRVVMEVLEDEVFQRHGDDVLIDLPVSPFDLMLGVKIEVPTLDGQVALKIPAGTQSHKIFRMRGKGIKHLDRNSHGDQLVRVIGWTPQKLDRKQKQNLKDLRENLAHQIPAPGRSLFD